jgi:hypothetical protein
MCQINFWQKKERKKKNNNNKKWSKHDMSPKLFLGDMIIIIIITRYDNNLTIMKSPKPATENRFKK